MREPDRAAAEIRPVQIVAASLMGGVAALTGVAWYLLTFAGFVSFDLPPVLVQAGLGVFLVSLPLVPLLRGKVDPPEAEGTATEIVHRYRAGTIVALAVREGAGLLGILLSLFAGSAPWALGYGAATLLLMGMGWPRAGELRERMRRAQL